MKEKHLLFVLIIPLVNKLCIQSRLALRILTLSFHLLFNSLELKHFNPFRKVDTIHRSIHINFYFLNRIITY